MEVECIQDLYKSTYNGFAFIKGKKYIEVTKDEFGSLPKEYIWIIDENKKAFNFSREQSNTMYNFKDYFKEI